MARVGTVVEQLRKEGYDDDGRNDTNGNPTPTAPGSADQRRRSSPTAARWQRRRRRSTCNAKWQFNANGAVPGSGMAWSSAANVFGRQGYPFPAYRSITLGLDGSNRVLVSNELDSQRYDNLWNVDVRFAKSFTMGMMRAQLIAGSLQHLQLEHRDRARTGTRQRPTTRPWRRTLSPRIWRFGAKLTSQRMAPQARSLFEAGFPKGIQPFFS